MKRKKNSERMGLLLHAMSVSLVNKGCLRMKKDRKQSREGIKQENLSHAFFDGYSDINTFEPFKQVSVKPNH